MTSMKKIVLVDRSLIYVDLILSKTDCEIAVLIIDNSSQDISNLVNNKRIGKIYTVAELDNWDSVQGLDFSIIQKCKAVQLLAENAMTRFTSDYNERKYRYYMGLSFWYRIFDSIAIDCVLIDGLLHGFIYDGVLAGIAKEYDVPVYTLNPWGINTYEKSIFCENTREHVELHNNKELSSVEEYYIDGKRNVLNFYNINLNKNRASTFREKIRDISYTLGGMIFCDFLYEIKNNLLLSKRGMCSSGIEVSFFDKLYSIYKMKKIKRYLTNIEKEVNLECDYIYFSLHFEPEGSIQTRCTLENQLVCIKMLSDALPSGYKIYVKEHPHQFLVNNKSFYSCYVPGVERFKSKYFYERISAMKNVEIVSHKYSAKRLIEKSKAVASLVGSCFFEAINAKKPIFLFSECHPLVNNKEILKCFSTKECRDNMDIIKNGYLPKYDNILSFLSRYIASSQDELNDNVIRVLAYHHEIEMGR